MDGFSNYNIFATKGIEYIIIIFFLLILIPFWIMFTRKVKVAVPAGIKILTADLLRIPQGLFFSRNHTWTHLEKSGNAKIGIDDFLLNVVGNAQINWMKSPGERLKKGELLARINQKGKWLNVYSPVSGEVTATNAFVQDNPEILDEDPYGQGWLYAIKPENWKAETSGFFLADEAQSWISEEIKKLKDFLALSLGKEGNKQMQLAYQEGGELIARPLAELPAEIWEDFQKEFLDEKT